MKSRVVRSIAIPLLLTSSTLLQSQSKPSNRNTKTTTTVNTKLTTVHVFGKVVVDDGSPLDEVASIQTICRGQKRTEGHTDSHGNFSFQLGSKTATSEGVDDAESTLSNARLQQDPLKDLRDCELQAALPGYGSEVIQLRSRLLDQQNTDLGKVVLHRLNQPEGYTISITSARAPDKARKALEKGLDQERKEKWEEAQESLEKAVEIYPKYASAWYELGRLQTRNQNANGARYSFTQALEADPKYLSAYRGLALLAMSENSWQDLVDSSGKLVEFSPVGFPDGWFLNAVGQYYLQNYTAAEKSARQGIAVDAHQEVPKLEYILGMILMKEHDYQQAGEHMRRYLYLSITSQDLEEARKQLAEIERATATASAPVPAENK